MDHFQRTLWRLTCAIAAERFRIQNERHERRKLMAIPPNKPRNLLRLAGVINAANSEADNEAGALIERVRLNKMRTLGLIAKGHQNETLREQMLSEAEKEQALADLAAAVGDNGGPLLEEEPDEAEEEIRATLKAAKASQERTDSDRTSQSSDEPQKPPVVPQNILAGSGDLNQPKAAPEAPLVRLGPDPSDHGVALATPAIALAGPEAAGEASQTFHNGIASATRDL